MNYLKVDDVVKCINPPGSPYGIKKGQRLKVKCVFGNLITTDYWAEPLFYRSSRFELIERIEK